MEHAANCFAKCSTRLPFPVMGLSAVQKGLREKGILPKWPGPSVDSAFSGGGSLGLPERNYAETENQTAKKNCWGGKVHARRGDGKIGVYQPAMRATPTDDD